MSRRSILDTLWSSAYQRRRRRIAGDKPQADVIRRRDIALIVGARATGRWAFASPVYDYADIDNLLAELRLYRVGDQPYSPKRYVCHNYAAAAWGVWNLNPGLATMAKFIVWLKQPGKEHHALNGAISRDGFFLIEPRTYRAYPLPEGASIVLMI